MYDIIFLGANPLWDPDEDSKPNGMVRNMNPLYRQNSNEGT